MPNLDQQVALNTENIAKRVLPNLLDNPWFTINQRNITYKSGFSYTVDRWMITTGDLTRKSDKSLILSTGTWFGQRLESERLKSGQTATVSILLANGTLFTGTATIPTGNYVKIISNTSLDCYLYKDAAGGDFETGLSINAKAYVTLAAVKLEYGDQSTLAYDGPPNEASELLKCMYYFQRISQKCSPTMYIYGARNVLVNLNYYFPLRGAPTITNLTGQAYVSGSLTNHYSWANTYTRTAYGVLLDLVWSADLKINGSPVMITADCSADL